jgi:hypothetical protein
MAIPPDESRQSDLSFPAIAVSTHLILLVFERSPSSLHQDFVVAAVPSRPTETNYVEELFAGVVPRPN